MDLSKFVDCDFQNLSDGGLAESNIPICIITDIYIGNCLHFMFKNTLKRDAIKWICSFAEANGLKIAKLDTFWYDDEDDELDEWIEILAEIEE